MQTLRFEARIHSRWPHDAHRRFVFNYFLADDTYSIYEHLPPNSGRTGGKFLARGKVPKPNTKVTGEAEFYSIEDFYIGERSIGLRVDLVDI
jgi:hypothetical protein